MRDRAKNGPRNICAYARLSWCAAKESNLQPTDQETLTAASTKRLSRKVLRELARSCSGDGWASSGIHGYSVSTPWSRRSCASRALHGASLPGTDRYPHRSAWSARPQGLPPRFRARLSRPARPGHATIPAAAPARSPSWTCMAPPRSRTESGMEEFRSGRVRMLIASDLAARGLGNIIRRARLREGRVIAAGASNRPEQPARPEPKRGKPPLRGSDRPFGVVDSRGLWSSHTP